MTRSIISFGAQWCGPCQRLKPILKAVGIPSYDIDLHPELAQQHRVTSVPTTVVLEDGEEVARLTGLVTESKLRSWLL